MDPDRAITRLPRPVASRVARWALVAIGVSCVGVGAVGAVVPGLPTTVFLIIAGWCFVRSCPWLEGKLLGLPIFRPFMAYVKPGASMPTRARVVTTCVILASVAVSGAILLFAMPSVWPSAAVLGSGIAGVWSVWRVIP